MERTREIGILMAIGWRPLQILRMLLAECILLCTIGAVIGNGFAIALLHVLNAIEAIGFGWVPLRFPLWLAGLSFLLAVGTGAMAMAWPAWLVFRIEPLAALRHE